jgi:hypothetical protein
MGDKAKEKGIKNRHSVKLRINLDQSVSAYVYIY